MQVVAISCLVKPNSGVVRQRQHRMSTISRWGSLTAGDLVGGCCGIAVQSGNASPQNECLANSPTRCRACGQFLEVSPDVVLRVNIFTLTEGITTKMPAFPFCFLPPPLSSRLLLSSIKSHEEHVL